MKLRVRSAPFETRYEAMRINKTPLGAEPVLFTALADMMVTLSTATTRAAERASR